MEINAGGQTIEDSKLKIFVIYYKPAFIFESDVFLPISNGARNFEYEKEILRDDTGINISEKNSHYGELTQHYWVWKNFMPCSNAEYIGFCHYRRFLDFNLSQIPQQPFHEIFIADFPNMFAKYTEENIIDCIGDADVLLSNKFVADMDMYQQYLMWHPEKDLKLALEVLNELYPEYDNAAKKVLSSKEMYICLNFVMKKELVNDFFEWMFNILTVLEKRSNWEEYTDYFNIRMPAYLAERFFNIWLEHNIQTKNLKVKNSTSILIDSDIEAYTAKLLAQINTAQNVGNAG